MKFHCPPPIERSSALALSFVVSLNVKRRNLRASQRAMAAAEAWNIAEKNGQVREGGKGGDRRSTNVQNVHWIKQPRDHFARLFEVGAVYVQQARVVLAEKNGQVQEGAGRPAKSAQNVHIIRQPRDHFAKLFEVGHAYVQQARQVQR